MKTITADELKDMLEKAVLDTLDRKMNELVHGAERPEPYKCGDILIRQVDAGWKDADLKTLLPAIRKHSDVLFERFFQ